MNTTHATFISRSNRWLAAPTLTLAGTFDADVRDCLTPGCNNTIDDDGNQASAGLAGEYVEVASR